MKLFHLFIAFSFLLLTSSKVFAQKMDKRLEKIIHQSEVLLKNKEFDKAERHLRFSINKVKEKDVIWYKLGDLAASQYNYEMAVEYYKLAMNFKPENREKYEMVVLQNLVLAKQYMEAEYHLRHIVPKYNWSTAKTNEYNKYVQFFENKNMIYSNLNAEVEIVNVGDAINSSYHEYFPSLSHDDSTMIFTRKFNGIEEDFFIVHRDTCMEQWYAAEHMGYPPNSTKNEGAQFLSYDRNYIFFMRCENEAQSMREAGGCDLYMSFMQKGDWVAPMAFGATINTRYFEGMPCLSTDNKTLYFVSDRPGGFGGKDIWKSIFTPYGWSVPINLGPQINTEMDEISPFIAADNKTLYFSSNGHVGFGGQDIFMATSINDTFINRPINLGLPYNSTQDDFGWFLLANGQKAYFSSDRLGGWGGMDIYSASVLPKYQPQPTSFITGVIVDSMSREPITNAIIEVYNDANELIISLFSNKGDGSYFVSLETYKTYTFKVRRYDYPEKVIEYNLNIFAHHPSIQLDVELLNWKVKRELNSQEIDNDSEEDAPKVLYEDAFEIVLPE